MKCEIMPHSDDVVVIEITSGNSTNPIFGDEFAPGQPFTFIDSHSGAEVFTVVVDFKNGWELKIVDLIEDAYDKAKYDIRVEPNDGNYGFGVVIHSNSFMIKGIYGDKKSEILKILGDPSLEGDAEGMYNAIAKFLK